VGCNCFWVAPYVGITNRPGLVRSADENYHWIVGRVSIPNSQVAISKVRSTDFFQWWSANAGENYGFTTTEVLICENNQFTTTPTPTPPKQCGKRH
jgi:hypothetical protein